MYRYGNRRLKWIIRFSISPIEHHVYGDLFIALVIQWREWERLSILQSQIDHVYEHVVTHIQELLDNGTHNWDDYTTMSLSEC